MGLRDDKLKSMGSYTEVVTCSNVFHINAIFCITIRGIPSPPPHNNLSSCLKWPAEKWWWDINNNIIWKCCNYFIYIHCLHGNTWDAKPHSGRISELSMLSYRRWVLYFTLFSIWLLYKSNNQRIYMLPGKLKTYTYWLISVYQRITHSSAHSIYVYSLGPKVINLC